MALPDSQNEVTTRRLLSLISGLWTNKIKDKFQTLTNKVTSWSATPSDDKYPSEKLVKTDLDKKLEQGELSGTYNLFSCFYATGSKPGFTREIPPNEYSGDIWHCIPENKDSYFSYKILESIAIGDKLVFSYDIEGLNTSNNESGSFTLAGLTGNTLYSFNSNGRHSHYLVSTKAVNANAYLTIFDDGNRYYSTAPSGFTIKNIKLERGRLATAYNRNPTEFEYRTIPQDISKGSNLIPNSNGTLLSNYNWSTSTFVANTDLPTGVAGCFHRSGGDVFCEEFISLNTDKVFICECTIL